MPADKLAAQQGTGNTTSDETMLIQLYEQFRRPIFTYAYRLLGNQEDADDVTQEVFVRACASWDNLYDHKKLSAWLYRLATNLCVDNLRRRKRRFGWLSNIFTRDKQSGEPIESQELAYFLADTGGIPEVAEREIIRMAIENLPIELAAALVLNAAQGISYQEVAEIVGISPQAAATRISRAKKKFVEHYQRLCNDGLDKTG
jgi:RNA polymerase sigma-70 factor (ECF subfamily)